MGPIPLEQMRCIQMFGNCAPFLLKYALDPRFLVCGLGVRCVIVALTLASECTVALTLYSHNAHSICGMLHGAACVTPSCLEEGKGLQDSCEEMYGALLGSSWGPLGALLGSSLGHLGVLLGSSDFDMVRQSVGSLTFPKGMRTP